MVNKYVRLLVLAVIVVSFVALPRTAESQMPCPPKKQPTPDEMGAMMAGMSSGMMKMMENMLDMMFGYLARPETATKLAMFTKHYYDELLKQGFTKEEAMRIVVSVGIPAMSAMK